MLLNRYFKIFLISFIFFSIFSYHSLYRHWVYSSSAFDLGIYTQVFYLYSQNLPPMSTLKHMNILGDHFEPILFILSPIYRLFPYAETLLIIQALFVSLSGTFIYLICLDKLKDKLQSSILTCLYLSFFGILSAINFDFHSATISTLPLSLLLYTWYFKKWKLYILTLFFCLLFKEDTPLFIIGLGLVSLKERQIKIGILIIIFGFLSYYIIKYRIMNIISPGAEDAYISTSVLSVINHPELFTNFFKEPDIFIKQFLFPNTKMYTFLALYGQFLFLPFISFLSWVTVFTYLLIRFSSSQAQYWGIHFHYNANLAPFLIISTLFALPKIRLPKYIINIFLVISILLGNIFLNNLIFRTFTFKITDAQKFNYLNETLKTIPANAAVSAQSPILPHIANREKIYLYPEVLDANYIIVDTSLDNYPMQDLEFTQRISSLMNSPEWKLEQQVNSLYIFKRNLTLRGS